MYIRRTGQTLLKGLRSQATRSAWTAVGGELVGAQLIMKYFCPVSQSSFTNASYLYLDPDSMLKRAQSNNNGVQAIALQNPNTVNPEAMPATVRAPTVPTVKLGEASASCQSIVPGSSRRALRVFEYMVCSKKQSCDS